MCADYTANYKFKSIEEMLAQSIHNHTGQEGWEARVRLTDSAPVILLNKNGEPEFQTYTFPVMPFPNSRLSGEDEKEEATVKRIYDKPRWKEAFISNPCLVPMSSFCEAVYWGPEAGTAQNFTTKENLFFVAGIVIKGQKPKTKKAFSLLTHTATEQMLNYHHRLLTILPKEKALTWLEEMPKEDRFNFLIENRYTGPLKIQKDRNLAKGWEKKVDLQTKKLNNELTYRKILKTEQVEG